MKKTESMLIDPTRQLMLSSYCESDCDLLSGSTIMWNIYQRSTINHSQWNILNRTSFYDSRWFFGKIKCDESELRRFDIALGLNSSNLTISSDMFSMNSQIEHWRFEVIYSIGSDSTSSSFDVRINRGPTNGNCSIEPKNGTSLTMFNVSCWNWFDADGIKDYSVFGLSNRRYDEMMLSYDQI